MINHLRSSRNISIRIDKIKFTRLLVVVYQDFNGFGIAYPVAYHSYPCISIKIQAEYHIRCLYQLYGFSFFILCDGYFFGFGHPFQELWEVVGNDDFCLYTSIPKEMLKPKTTPNGISIRIVMGNDYYFFFY